jgi:large subunit ribosomal protein L29
MKVSELRNKSVDELMKEMIALLKEQFNLRMQRGTGQAPKPHLFRNVRKAIARIKTLLREKGTRV